jgi:type II secretory pathway pseudopilin PulG
MRNTRARAANLGAFTLLEVIVGLFLMGSLVASSLVALSSHQHAILLAKQKHLANDIAENLLSNWYEFRGDIPTRAQGLLSNAGTGINENSTSETIADPWLWRTQPIGSRMVCGMQVAVIRLEVFRRIGNQKRPQSLASFELLQRQGANVLQ